MNETIGAEIRADLHCHSTHSDGSCTPQELLKIALDLGLNGLAITDHDAISSYETLKSILPSTPLRVIPGVELSTSFGKLQIHVLGYAFNPEDKAIQEFCASCRIRRVERNREILERLWSSGIKVEEQDIATTPDDRTAYGRPHIALAMMQKGYVETIQEAFQRYIGEGKPCYVPGQKYATCEAIDVIHASHGKAVIAHPHLIPKKKTVDELLKFPFDGIEAYYSRFPESVNKKWVKVAEEKGLFTTGGSDFHGTMKPEIRLGSQLTPEPVFLYLWNHFQEVRG